MKVKKLILDQSKWICGTPAENDNKNNCLGSGETKLLNTEGFMCCLGQFAKQLNSKIDDNILLGKGKPASLKQYVRLLNEQYLNPANGYTNTNLSDRAISINDNTDTTVKKKKSLLKDLFAKKGYKIVFT